MNITNYQKCCGCAVCADICPKQCITMVYDKFGFYTPSINDAVCIKCKKCIAACPTNKTIEKNDILSICKGHAISIESKEHQLSTSGAIFPLLAEHIIKRTGHVVGVAFDPDYKNVSHIICKDMSQVNRCRGSKYIQSQTRGIYKTTKALLDSGNLVLFSGTPCQVAALKSYLGKIPPNLYTVDFVCHGVGSTHFYQDYLNELLGGKEAIHVGFRDKCGDYLKSKFRVIDSNHSEIINCKAYTDLFGKAFAENLISRSSCGSCTYATAKRVSDITLSDNILINSDKERQFGSSFIFINSAKGEYLFRSIAHSLDFEELEKEDIIPRIMHLNHPAIPHRNRDKLLKVYVKHGCSAASKYITHYFPKQTAIRRLYHTGMQILNWFVSPFKK